MKKKKAIGWYIFFVLVVLITPSLAISAMIDPSFRFSSIETEHFVIHFHQGIDEIANKVALISEDIHLKLSSEFQWTPAEKTQIVLLDDTDFANGLTTVLPYNAIYIYVVPPMPDMTIGEYEDWLELVVLHEYAHVLTMDPVSGYSSVMRKIFGKPLPGYDPLSSFLFLFTVPPNVFMPDWWLEGMATWAETEFSTYGRGRSTYYEMILRMAVLENRIPRIDHLNGDVPYWPDGNIPYLYGMMLERYIAEKYGEETLGKLNITHAGRFPFFISAPPKKLTGRHYLNLYRDMVNKLMQEQKEKVDHLKSEPLTEFKILQFNGERLTNPRISPNGKHLAFNRQDPHHHEEIVIVDIANFKEISRIRRLPSDHNISWSPDSKKLYFTQADLRDGFNLYQDIYSYDLEDDSVKRITKNLRAKDIDVSPDGKYIVFVKVETGRQNLAILSIETENPPESPHTPLWKRVNPPQSPFRKGGFEGDLKVGRGGFEVITDFKDSAISGLRWSPDSSFIVFAKRDNKGQTSLEILNVKTKTIETLFIDKHNNIYPTWSPDGKYIIFTSDGTGVYNLFAYSLADNRVFQVTHALGGAFHADISVSGDKIFFSGYHSKGFYIAEMPYDPSRWSTNYSPAIRPVWGNEDKGQVKESPERKDPVKVSEKRDYSALPTLLPGFWLPTLTSDHDGAVFGAFTAGQDVLGYHTYILQAGYGVSNQAYYDVSYIYDRWYPSFYLRGYSLPDFYSEFFNNEYDYYERQSGMMAGIKIPLNYLESKFSMIAGYHLEKVEHLTQIRGRKVNGLDVYEGRRDNIFAGIEYRNALKYPYSISREEGRDITLLYKDYSKSLGSGLTQREYSANYKEFIGLGKHHVIYLNLKGATSDGDLIAQQAYQLGGIPSATNDYYLRGFSSKFKTGRSVVTGTLEYRFPAYYIFKGWSTKPFFMDRLHCAVFTDTGNVWGYKKRFHWDDFDVGIGTEARLDMVLGYKISITPAIGIAHGITGDGETQVYFNIYVDL